MNRKIKAYQAIIESIPDGELIASQSVDKIKQKFILLKADDNIQIGRAHV